MPNAFNIPTQLNLTANTDFRGTTSILFDRAVSEELGFDLVQINQGYSKKAFTLRGLHFQKAPHEQAKLVQVLCGSVLNIAVDIRPLSSAFGVCYAETMRAGDGRAIYIPRGFAHGYLTLEDDTLVQWCVDNDFSASAAMCLRFDDENITDEKGGRGIVLPCARDALILSERDRNGMGLKEIYRM